ncbi:MAG: hypothetical protein E7647_06415 [Ruminococcaceae bacterium]|nr:hypothetical protein [Oscillospiraceae bacterium]
MKLFDLHCDTPYELSKKKQKLKSNDLHVSLEKAEIFDKYIQCAAVWSDSEKSDSECLESFCGASAYFEKEAGGYIETARELEGSQRYGFILTVEDSRLLCGDLSSLRLLYERGARAMTLLWGGKSSVGSAWNAHGSLTDFGKEVLEGCFDIGIVPDLSHANDTVISYALERAEQRKKPVIATHSNSRSICPHMRNLTDENAVRIAAGGGIIGISLFPPHLRGETAEISDIISHIDHYISILGTESVCLGCDLDGIGSTPEGISHIGDLARLYDALSKSHGSYICERVFYNNAYIFFINNLPQGRT